MDGAGKFLTGRDDAGNEVTSGVYFIRLSAGQEQVMGRMIVQK